jgi:hypothetical protein
MSRLIHKNKWVVVGSMVGALVGFLYWKWVGCSSGTCMITSNPYRSTIYGAFIFGGFFNLFRK